jgi:hypothetical protein
VDRYTNRFVLRQRIFSYIRTEAHEPYARRVKLAWRWLAFGLAVAWGCGSPPSERASGTEGTTELGDTAASNESDDDGRSDDTAHDDTSTSGDVGDGDDTTTGEEGDPPVYAPEIYPPGRTHSPITAWAADRLRQIAATRADRFEDVFMKVGASSTVSTNTLHCFAGDDVELGAHARLDPTLQFHLGGDASGTTPFDRVTLAAQSGQSAGWANEGDPSPLRAELDALSPRVALVHYGANDMGLGATYDAALQTFYGEMSTLLDTLEDEGVIPILFGITRRADDESADRWVATWNATIRGLAQSRQTPFVDLHHAIDPLPGHGLATDGLHLEAYEGGACILDDAGLQHGYNVRNLVALEALDRAAAVLVDDVDAIEDPGPERVGTGTQADPILVDPDALPFADARDTAAASASRIDLYGCAESDESGPEIWYRIELAEPRRLRVVVLDREGVDVDVHVLDDTGDPAGGCIARDDRIVELPLQAGTWHVVVDTWSDAGGPLAGAYLLLVVECDPGDDACD